MLPFAAVFRFLTSRTHEFFPLRRTGWARRRIYAAFLLAAVIPTALAGALGVYLSLQALKNETLRNLDHEVSVRAQGIGRFFDQLSSELLYLACARGLVDLIAASRRDHASAAGRRCALPRLAFRRRLSLPRADRADPVERTSL